MVSEELKAFNLKLENNPEFKAQVEDVRILLTGIEVQSLKEQLDEFHKEIPLRKLEPNTSRLRSLDFKKWAVAAVLILSVGGFWFFNQNTNDKLYAKYFTPDPGLPTTMSNSANYSFYDAMVDYKQGDYKSAIQKWEALNSKNDTVNYFLGVSHLALKNQDNAIAFLEKSIQDSDFSLASEANFYLGLAYLKDNQIEKAIEHLKKSESKESKMLLSELLN